jgi:hypothetical protein
MLERTHVFVVWTVAEQGEAAAVPSDLDIVDARAADPGFDACGVAPFDAYRAQAVIAGSASADLRIEV